MFEITPKIRIEAPPAVVWEFLIDVNNWWLESNPEHIELDVRSADEEIQNGTRIFLRERIAGIPGEALGEISEFDEQRKLTWESDDATYSYFGVRFSVQEGVTWQIKPVDRGTELSAHVWAYFPDGLPGTILEWWFKHVIDGVNKDYEHAMTELRYIKREIERSENGSKRPSIR